MTNAGKTLTGRISEACCFVAVVSISVAVLSLLADKLHSVIVPALLVGFAAATLGLLLPLSASKRVGVSRLASNDP